MKYFLNLFYFFCLIYLFFVIEFFYSFCNFSLLLRYGIKHMIPPGYCYSKTFIGMFAMMMYVKFMYFRKNFCR